MTTWTKHKAHFNGTCKECGLPYKSGEMIIRVQVGKFIHYECPAEVLDTEQKV